MHYLGKNMNFNLVIYSELVYICELSKGRVTFYVGRSIDNKLYIICVI